MDHEAIVGGILTLAISWICGALFYGIGWWSDRKKTPMGFWSGMELKAEWVRDIPAYNHECAIMWKVYSIPYFICGILGLLGMFHVYFTVAMVILMVGAIVPGLIFLIRHYKKIELKYISREMLDKVDPFC